MAMVLLVCTLVVESNLYPSKKWPASYRSRSRIWHGSVSDLGSILEIWHKLQISFHSSWHLFRSNFHCIMVATSFSLRFCLIPLWQLFHAIFHSFWHFFQSYCHFFRVVTSFSLAFRVNPMGHQESGHMICCLKWESAVVFKEKISEKQKKSWWFENSFGQYLNNGITSQHDWNRSGKLQCRTTIFIFFPF